jgi:hypothetical protein
MLVPHEAMTLELRLLLACTKVTPGAAEVAALRGMLEAGPDWTALTEKAIDHGLTALVGHGLRRVGADLVPPELLEAFGVVMRQTRGRNVAMFAELADLLAALGQEGVVALPLKGPVLAIEAFGDLGVRAFRDLDFLVRDADLGATLGLLRRLGYVRTPGLTEVQLDLIHRAQGQEIIFNGANGTCIEPHSRLTSMKMALDIDYDGLWARARPARINGRSLMVLAPEDEVLILAIHGGKEMWWSIKWACDFVAFVDSHPGLDWRAVVERARAQGCVRMILLAAALAHCCFGATVPRAVLGAAEEDAAVGPMVMQIVAQWEAAAPMGPPDNATVSMDRLRLHDGWWRRVGFVVRTLFLPGPQYIAALALPRWLGFVYIPLKLANDLIGMPVLRAWRWGRKRFFF